MHHLAARPTLFHHLCSYHPVPSPLLLSPRSITSTPITVFSGFAFPNECATWPPGPYQAPCLLCFINPAPTTVSPGCLAGARPFFYHLCSYHPVPSPLLLSPYFRGAWQGQPSQSVTPSPLHTCAMGVRSSLPRCEASQTEGACT